MTVDGGVSNLTEALGFVQVDQDAKGFIVELQLGRGTFSEPPQIPSNASLLERRKLATQAAKDAVSIFDASTLASEVRILGDGAVFRDMRSTLFTIQPGSPPIRFSGLVFRNMQSLAPAIIVHGGDVTFDGCVFDANPSALLVDGGHVDITNSTFTRNGHATKRGGAIDIDAEASLQIESSAFFANVAMEGGAIRLSGDASLMINSSSFTANLAELGGAFFTSGAARLSLSNTLITENNATHGAALNVADNARVILSNQTALVNNNKQRLLASTVQLSGYASSTGTGGTEGRFLYLLPAPLAHWIANSITCNAHASTLEESCTPEFYGQTYSSLPFGTLEGNYPFACNAGLFGNTTLATHQSSPQCSGTCPSRYVCAAATVIERICPKASFCGPGSAAPIRCEDGTFGAKAGLASQRECTRCGEGYWCASGIRYACPAGTFNPRHDASNILDCLPCPSNSNTTHSASTNVDACVCESGFYDASMLAIGDASSISCRQCPLGTNCGYSGITIGTLPLMRGYFRLTNRSTQVMRCGDAAANCSHQLQECPTSSSGCFGGPNFQQRCNANLSGVFCLLCQTSSDDERQYYISASPGGPARCELCATSIGAGYGILIGGTAGALCTIGLCIVLATYLGYRCLPSLVTPRFVLELLQLWIRFSLLNKIKTCLALYLMLSKFPDVYDVAPPDLAARWLSSLNFISSFGIDFIQATPLVCLGFGGFLSRLKFFFALLPCLSLLIVMGSAVYLHAMHRFQLWRLVEVCISLVLRATFLLYPLITAVSFQAFSCYDFPEENRYFLRADVSIECNTPQHDQVLSWAWASIIIYVGGLWLMIAALLAIAYPAIRWRRPTRLSQALSFLCNEYRPELCWWELVEMLRRALFVGFFRLLPPGPGSITQISIAALVSIASLTIQIQAAPHVNLSDGWVAMAASVNVVVFFLWAIIATYGKLTDAALAQVFSDQTQAYRLNFKEELCFFAVVGTLFFTFCLLLKQIRDERQRHAAEARFALARRLRYRKNGHEVQAPKLPQSLQYHLFLSHGA